MAATIRLDKHPRQSLLIIFVLCVAFVSSSFGAIENRTAIVHWTQRSAAGPKYILDVLGTGELIGVVHDQNTGEETTSHGSLNANELAELLKLFADWSTLEDSYKPDPNDQRLTSITYNGKTVTAQPFGGAPPAFEGPSHALTRLSSDRTSPTIPMAKATDIEVGTLQDSHKKSLVFIRNTSKNPVKVYCPGLVSGVSYGNESITSRVPSTLGMYNFVALQAGQMIAWPFEHNGGDEKKQVAYYILYAEGHEGEPDHVIGSVNMDKK